jgi:hypothetical protein
VCQCWSEAAVDLPTHTHMHAQTGGNGCLESLAAEDKDRDRTAAPLCRRRRVHAQRVNGESGAILGLSTRAFLTTGLVGRCKGECGVRAVEGGGLWPAVGRRGTKKDERAVGEGADVGVSVSSGRWAHGRARGGGGGGGL